LSVKNFDEVNAIPAVVLRREGKLNHQLIAIRGRRGKGF
jgi:hypothetical protein